MELSAHLLLFAVQLFSTNQTLDYRIFYIKIIHNTSDCCPWVEDETPEFSWNLPVQSLNLVVQNISTNLALN